MNAPEPAATNFPFDNSYARLPERFYARLDPIPVPAPGLIRVNEALARHLYLDADQLKTPAGVEILAGNRVPEGAEPLAMAYAGHQFGGFAPQLGDGRAILLGEIVDRDGVRRDVQLKGSGRTPFSRQGDGRAVLGPVLREYVVSEAMAALGVRTTRALAAVTTGEDIPRERFYPGAILTRVAESLTRVGTFQFFAAREDLDAVRTLADHVIARHYPDLAEADHPYRALLDAVVARQAALVAHWQSIGFIHGVMNTDNTSIIGETIDYGPCAFMDTYHPDTVYSSIDYGGRYAYAQQPRAAHWNLAVLAQTILPLLGDTADDAVAAAKESIEAFPEAFDTAYRTRLRAKLGLAREEPGDTELCADLLKCMEENRADFTLTFRGLCDVAAESDIESDAVREQFDDKAAFDVWSARWRERLSRDDRSEPERHSAMRAVNPAFIPRNHLVEEVIVAAVNELDFEPFEDLLAVLASPYENQPDRARYALPPRPEQIVRRTFCGT